MLVLQQMFIFLLLMLVGIAARRKGFLTEANQPQITQIVMNIAYPAIILSGVTGDGPHIEGMELLKAVGVILALLALMLLAAWLLPRLLRFPERERGIVNVMVVFTNIGFMGVPMIDGIYGKDALIYMTVLLIPFNLLFFSYAIETIKGGSGEGGSFTWRSLVNPGMTACFLAIIIYLADIRLPYVLSTSIRMLGAMTAPLVMMLMGASLLDTEWKGIYKDARILIFMVMKMIVIPVVIMLLLEQFVSNIYLLAVCMATVATPAGNVIPLLAGLYNKSAYQTSVKGVALSTLVAVVTMPIVAFLTGLG